MISREEHAQGLTLVTVSDIGSNHRALLLPNQDSVDFIIDGEDFVLAVSDGVGSCPRAELGSKEAVASCIRVFTLIKNRIIEFESDNVVDALINEWRVSLDHENLDDYLGTAETKRFLSKSNAQRMYDLADKLNQIRRKVSHDTDERFEPRDYDFYMANVFELINGLLEAYKED